MAGSLLAPALASFPDKKHFPSSLLREIQARAVAGAPLATEPSARAASLEVLWEQHGTRHPKSTALLVQHHNTSRLHPAAGQAKALPLTLRNDTFGLPSTHYLPILSNYVLFIKLLWKLSWH